MLVDDQAKDRGYCQITCSSDATLGQKFTLVIEFSIIDHYRIEEYAGKNTICEATLIIGVAAEFKVLRVSDKT